MGEYNRATNGVIHSVLDIPWPAVSLVLLLAGLTSGHAFAALPASITVSPARVLLEGPEDSQQLLVQDPAQKTGQTDLTHQVRYLVADPKIARVNASGLVSPLAEGRTLLKIVAGKRETTVPIEVRGIQSPQPVSFETQIIPLLTKSGCNSGGCHGKAEGQNGFKLSVFGFDPQADFLAIVSESRGRRLLASSPENSLFVLKATGRIPHGGGRKIAEDSLGYKRLVRWLREGALLSTPAQAAIASIELEPRELVMGPALTQQLKVTAIDVRGHKHCVTREAEYATNEPAIAGVDAGGNILTGTIPGEAAILVRYMGQVNFCRVTVPMKAAPISRPPEFQVIDGLVWDRLTRLGIAPSDLADDATFLRRVYLDTIGTLPTAQEARTFLADRAADKRNRLIDQLLTRPEYADFWAMKWADLLRVDRDALTAQGSVAMTLWLREQFGRNRPYHEMAREIVTAIGNPNAIGPAGFFKALDTPEAMSRSISQLFLGVRIECAQCHHHPSEKWGQDDYFALAGFFTGVKRKAGSTGEKIASQEGFDVKHPKTEKPVETRVLGGKAVRFSAQQDRREVLADWMIAPENPYFSRAIVNRTWAHYFGRGLIEPIDDLRATNPAVNEPLLEALSKRFVQSGYDLKALTRLILQSRVYQLAAQTPANASDEQNFSHALPRALPAEVLLDAICQATGIPEKFNGWPEGARSIQLWDNRMPSYFLKIFGRPGRTSVCECERSGEPSMAQALHLMNAPQINAKIHHRKGRARKLADSTLSPDQLVEELFLTALARFPSPAERKAMLELFAEPGASRKAAVEDGLWALLNTREFVYNH